jgi:hypothetical protein
LYTPSLAAIALADLYYHHRHHHHQHQDQRQLISKRFNIFCIMTLWKFGSLRISATKTQNTDAQS